jgi:iron complex outermembrane receptor protein
VNLGIRNAYGVELNLTHDFAEWWKTSSDFNFFRAAVSGNFREVDYSADITSWSGRVNNRFDLFDRLQLQLTFEYNAPRNTPQGRDLGIYAVDLGASMDILAGKGTLTLSGRDIFNTRIQQRIINLPEYTSRSDFQWRRAQSIVLSFSYRLNQEKRTRR